MVKQMQPELKQAPITAVRAMNDRIPAVAPTGRAQIDHPQVRQAGRQQQARQPLGLAEMTLVDPEATALLIRKEGFDLPTLPIPLDGLLSLSQIADQLQWCLVGSLPDGQCQHRAIARLRHVRIRDHHDLIWRDRKRRERNVGRPRPDQDVASRAADVLPPVAGKLGLQLGAIKFAIAQEDHRRVWRQIRLDLRN